MHTVSLARAFQQRICCSYPTVYKLFGFLRWEQGHQEVITAQLGAGHPPPKKRTGDELRCQRLMEVAKRYGDNDVVAFLRNMTANVEINL